MFSRYRVRGLAAGAAALLLGWLPVAGTGPEDDVAVTRATMAVLADALATAFQLSLDQDRFEAQENRQNLKEALGVLADVSSQLLTHGGDLERSTQYLRTTLAKEAAQVLTALEAGELDDARVGLHLLTEQCFACHSRLPAGDATLSPVVRDLDVESLGLPEQVRFFVATRRFDAALAAIETALLSPDRHPSRDAGLLEDYLKLSVRVRESFDKARDTLRAFGQRPDLPAHMADRIETWVDSLEMLARRGEMPVNLSNVRILIEEGELRNQFPADKRGAVFFVAASGLLHRLLEAGATEGVELAEAYYLLGITEAHISSVTLNEQTEFFLEAAIRLRPNSAIGRQAYDFLREYIVTKYSGSAGVFIPEEVWKNLNELRKLTETGPDRG